MQLGDLSQFAELDAHGRVDVRLCGATCGGQPGELPCRIPVEWTLTSERSGQVAEHGEVLERVLGLGSVSHDREPTACVGGNVRRHDCRGDDDFRVDQ